jgi:alanyl-tRNA synthetase
MARERGYLVDISGFEQALAAQRKQSQDERKSRRLTVSADDFGDETQWSHDEEHRETRGEFVGYGALDVDTAVVAIRELPDNRVAVMLRETPFYAESGGQISDRGTIVGDGWSIDVDDVRKVDGRIAAIGRATGQVSFGRVHAKVPRDRRLDTERNHTATHLLHAALRLVLGEHVHQAGSLVAPDRLRFDFTHHGPVTPEQLAHIEAHVNEAIWVAAPVRTREEAYATAVANGAMALFGEKYGDVVRVVEIPGLSVELCGGTHVRNTAEIAMMRIVSEAGIAAGVRRIEAFTGPRAFELLASRDRMLFQLASKLKVQVAPSGAGLELIERKIDALIDERRQLEKRVADSMRGGSGGSGIVGQLLSRASQHGNTRVLVSRATVADVRELQALGDGLREALGSGVAVIGAEIGEGKGALLALVTDDLREGGVRADVVVREVAQRVGGKGGGKPHMAQAGIDVTRIDEALSGASSIVAALLPAGT